MTDVRGDILSNPHRALQTHGKEAVCHELDEMSHHDLAGDALKAAHALGFRNEACIAARIVRNSGHWNDLEELAKSYVPFL